MSVERITSEPEGLAYLLVSPWRGACSLVSHWREELAYLLVSR